MPAALLSIFRRYLPMSRKICFWLENRVWQKAVKKASALSSASVDLAEQTVEAVSGSTADFEKSGKEVSFILVPQKSSSVTLKVTSDGVEKTFVLGELSGASVPSDLEGGKQLTVELRVSQGKIELGNVSISGWENQGTIGGEIIM